jgi:hypothetical protein
LKERRSTTSPSCTTGRASLCGRSTVAVMPAGKEESTMRMEM